LVLGMSFFDAITHSFATVATGGFSPRNASVAYFNSPAIEIVIMVFMILSGLHFALIILAITDRIDRLWKSSIVRYYIGAMAVGVILVAVNIHSSVYDSWLASFRYAAFQVISLGTSTGFANTDSNIWPGFSKLILIFFSLQCACAGSTSGGIKVDRILVTWKSFVNQLKKMFHPKAVLAYRLDKTVIEPGIIEAGLIYVALYLCVVFISSLILTFIGVDIMSAFSGTVAAMGNVGPGFGMVSSLSNFSQIPEMGKWVLSVVMLLGRLEIFALLMFLFYRVVR
jgi:trk system potassium uptake protein TrkH